MLPPSPSVNLWHPRFPGYVTLLGKCEKLLVYFRSSKNEPMLKCVIFSSILDIGRCEKIVLFNSCNQKKDYIRVTENELMFSKNLLTIFYISHTSSVRIKFKKLLLISVNISLTPFYS